MVAATDDTAISSLRGFRLHPQKHTYAFIPALYIASLITSGICGALAGIVEFTNHSMASPGLFTSIQFIEDGNQANTFWIIVIMAIAITLSFALILIINFEYYTRG